VVATGALLLVVLAVVATWAARGGVDAGLTAAARLLRDGPPGVHDFKQRPARLLRPAPTPAPFASAADAARPPAALPGPDGRERSLPDILEATRTLALVVVQRDRIVFEHHAPGRSPSSRALLFSVSKSVLATLVGMAVDDGLIRSVDQPVTDFVPELARQGFSRTTLRQLLDMRSGLDYDESPNPFGLHVLMNFSPRLEPLLLGLRRRDIAAPGFRYTSGDTALLSLALRRALAPESLTAYAQRRLWDPLGMEDGGVWLLDRTDGMERAWCCIAASARDLAKLGRLHLHGGRVQGRRLLSAQWVARSAAGAGDDGRRAYAQGWWPAGRHGTDFLATGRDGQFLYVSPAHDTVVVRLGEVHGYDTMAGWSAVFAALAAHDWLQRGTR
jgi:CubicO group peptidase (beta-lactamase class C family)